METALEFLTRLRALVENLPRRKEVAEQANELLNKHNQEVQDICLSHQPQSIREGMLRESRDRLILMVKLLQTRPL